MMVAVDATAKGEIKKEQVKWTNYGWQGGSLHPCSTAIAFITLTTAQTSPPSMSIPASNSGYRIWERFKRLRQCSPMANFTSALRTESSSFLKPSATGCEILDQDQLGTETHPEAIIGFGGNFEWTHFCGQRISSLCIGKKATQSSSDRASAAAVGNEVSSNPATHVQVVPTELILKPGDKVNFRARLFDAQGNFIREETAATWSLEQLKGTVENGQFTAGA